MIDPFQRLANDERLERQGERRFTLALCSVVVIILLVTCLLLK